MRIEGPRADLSVDAERILRTLPQWFGIEPALRQYARDAAVHPTFAALDEGRVVAFLTAREHYPQAWEVHCLAVQADSRRRGVGRGLHRHVEEWLAARGVKFLQVKTMSESSASAAYAETRAFYAAIGYTPIEEFPLLWGPNLPVLQLVKALS